MGRDVCVHVSVSVWVCAGIHSEEEHVRVSGATRRSMCRVTATRVVTPVVVGFPSQGFFPFPISL